MSSPDKATKSDAAEGIRSDPFPVLVRQHSGHETVRVFEKPEKGAKIVGEVDSGETVQCSGKAEEQFVHIVHPKGGKGGFDGWIGVKNIDRKTPPKAEEPAAKEARTASPHSKEKGQGAIENKEAAVGQKETDVVVEKHEQSFHQFVSRTEGDFTLKSSGGDSVSGQYVFDMKTGVVISRGLRCGKFSCDSISAKPFTTGCLDVPADKTLPCIGIADTEIMAEIQNPSSDGAYFVLPSQLNGAEYPSHESIVTELEKYKYDNTGGPRGQLAAHPAAAQFVLDNAAHDKRPNGINAIDQILETLRAAGLSFELKNGYLKMPQPDSEDEAKNAKEVFISNLHTLRPLVMEGVPATGLVPSKKNFAETSHKVSLVYASAVPIKAYLNNPRTTIQSEFHVHIAEAVLFAQYYGSLKTAASRTTDGKCKVFLMPLGGGVFNNPWEIIAKSMSLAVEMLTAEELAKLDINALTWSGNPSERKILEHHLGELNKLR